MNECAQGVDVALQKAGPQLAACALRRLERDLIAWRVEQRATALRRYLYCISWNELRTDVWP